MDNDKLWTAFFADRENVELRNQLVLSYRDAARTMARRIARKRIGRRLTPDETERLESRVDLTLIRTLPRFDPSRADPLKTLEEKVRLHVWAIARSAVNVPQSEVPIPGGNCQNDDGESLVDEQIDPQTEGTDQQQEVKEAIQRLPDDERSIVVQRFYGGRTFPEIAVDLDMPLRTVQRRYDKALDRPRRRLGVNLAAGQAAGVLSLSAPAAGKDVNETLGTAA